jgi:Fe/S biogenesis protein NfuA
VVEEGSPMLQYTDKARDWIAKIIEQQPEQDYVVRLQITGRGSSGFQYDMGLVKEDEATPDDVVVDNGRFRTLVDVKSAENLRGATVDLVEQLGQSNLKIDNPNPLWSDPVAVAVQKVLDEEINPGVAGHGGWVQLLDVRDGIAYIQMGGGCHGCGMSNVTLKQGVEVAIQRAAPSIHTVLDTTDHAAGTNPYYRATGASPFA